MTSELILMNASLPLMDEEHLYTLTVRDGKWHSIEAQNGIKTDEHAVPIDHINAIEKDNRMLDLEEKMVLPGLVDAHMHLDKAFCLPKVGNLTGTLEEAVQNYSLAVSRFSKEEIKARIMRSALQALSFGTTTIRTHLDFHVKWGTEIAFRTIEAAIEAKEELAPYLELQLFPLTPFFLFTSDEVSVLEEAYKMGLTGLGGAPHLSRTPERDIDILFRLAQKLDCPIDLHTDESDDPNIRTLGHVAKKAIDYGWSGRVTVDHLCSLSAMNKADAGKLIEQMVKADLKAVTLPGVNLYLQGRQDTFPVRRGVTRVKELLAAGIPLAAASDNIHDPFHPFGRGDLIQIGLITAYAAHMGSPMDIRKILKMITEIPATVLGLSGYGIKAGNSADFVVIDSITPEELFTMVPERRWVYRKDRWLKLASKRAEWSDPILAGYWNKAEGSVPFGRHIIDQRQRNIAFQGGERA